MRHNKLDLNLLVALDALLEESSVSRAADRVFITQSAMSNALGRLRRHFQDELIVQVGRKMVLTEKSESLRGEVRGILLRINEVTRPVDVFEPRTATRTFKIAASDYFSTVALPGMLTLLSERAPLVQIEVMPLAAKLSEELERGEVDLLVVPRIYGTRNYPSSALFKDHWACVAWNENTTIQKKLTLRTYLASEHVAKRKNHPDFPPMDDWDLAKLKLTRNVVVRVPQYGLLPFSVVGTQRIATVQRRLAQIYAKLLPISIHACPFKYSLLEEVMQWHPLREADSGHRWLRGVIELACNELN